MKHPDITEEVLMMEAEALENDRELYLECMNNKTFSERKTLQEQRDGLIIFWHVYMPIKNKN